MKHVCFLALLFLQMLTGVEGSLEDAVDAEEPRSGEGGDVQRDMERRSSRQVARPPAASSLGTRRNEAESMERYFRSKLSGSGSRRKSGLAKVHGTFNPQNYSCATIQTKSCKDASDCDGCLGLYTCVVSKGKCDLKGVSRKESGFFQSLQNT